MGDDYLEQSVSFAAADHLKVGEVNVFKFCSVTGQKM